MPALASVQSAFPSSRPQIDRAASDLTPQLERLRQRFGMDFATLCLLEDDQLVPNCSTGTPFPALADQARFSDQVLTAPLVVPDTALDQRFADLGGIRFYAGIPLIRAGGHVIGLLNLFDRAPRSNALATRLAAETLLPVDEPASQARIIARLQAQLDSQARLIQQQASALAHSRLNFERAAATARIGVWECDLATEKLTWTDGVYDLFELPRGSVIDRALTLTCYSDASRTMLEQLRARAVEHGIGFTLDAEITTIKGKHRWMRLTTSVESENGVATSIFGMKQDITEEKILADRTRYLAEFDVMTGLANRSRFQTRLADPAAPIGTLLLVDLDGFKSVNDNFGHALGDECLKEIALRLQAAGGAAELVARIGGDEFAVLLGPHFEPPACRSLAQQIVDQLGQPIRRGERILQLGASVGIAHAGPDITPDLLFQQADTALYAAKTAGRNTFRVFTPNREPALG